MYAWTTQAWIFVYPYCSVNENLGILIANTFVELPMGQAPRQVFNLY